MGTKSYNVQTNINRLLFESYIFIVCSLQIFVNFCGYTNNKIVNRIYIIILSGLLIIPLHLISACMFRMIQKYTYRHTVISRNNKIISFAVFSSLCFVFLFIWYLGYNPGGFSGDSIDQYSQAVNGTYSDWHPAWHTLLVFTLPIKLIGTTSSIILCQITYFSLILGYMAETIYEILNIKCAILAFAYILSNPYTGTIAMYPWKDVTFAITVLWIMCVVVRIIFKKYNSDKLKIQIILPGILMANATVFRHNAILFTGTLLIALLFVLERKQALNLVIICATMLILIKGPAYFILNVVPAEKRTREVVGLPLTIKSHIKSVQSIGPRFDSVNSFSQNQNPAV